MCGLGESVWSSFCGFCVDSSPASFEGVVGVVHAAGEHVVCEEEACAFACGVDSSCEFYVFEEFVFDGVVSSDGFVGLCCDHDELAVGEGAAVGVAVGFFDGVLAHEFEARGWLGDSFVPVSFFERAEEAEHVEISCGEEGCAGCEAVWVEVGVGVDEDECVCGCSLGCCCGGCPERVDLAGPVFWAVVYLEDGEAGVACDGLLGD